MNRFGRRLSALALVLVACGAAFAQDAIPEKAPGKGKAAASAPPPLSEPPPPVYEDKLLRLSEILGSLTFLRDLCGDSDGASWREEMNSLLQAENPPPLRRGRLIARFNHGYETYNAVYRVCTPAARLAVARYLEEGKELASDVRGRYSQ